MVETKDFPCEVQIEYGKANGHRNFRNNVRLRSIKDGDNIKLLMNSMSYYDTIKVHDATAKPSPTMRKAHINDKHCIGDGDTWREGVFYAKGKHRNAKGKHRIYFVSQLTGKKVRDEPPTGASKVMYLRDAARERRMNHLVASS